MHLLNFLFLLHMEVTYFGIHSQREFGEHLYIFFYERLKYGTGFDRDLQN